MKLASTTQLLIALGLTIALTAAAAPGFKGLYDGPGVVVSSVDARGNPVTLVDTGAVVCEDVDGDGVPDRGTGGVCIPFDGLRFGPNEWFQDSIHVRDQHVPDNKLAFQVCVDLNGDNKCTFGGEQAGPSVPVIGGGGGACSDLIFFSHESNTGANHNPLFVDPVSAYDQYDKCNSTGFPGYVVITCAGTHVHTDAPDSSHTHHVTKGSASTTFTGGTPHGDFCGAPLQEKSYVVR